MAPLGYAELLGVVATSPASSVPGAIVSRPRQSAGPFYTPRAAATKSINLHERQQSIDPDGVPRCVPHGVACGRCPAARDARSIWPARAIWVPSLLVVGPAIPPCPPFPRWTRHSMIHKPLWESVRTENSQYPATP